MIIYKYDIFFLFSFTKNALHAVTESNHPLTIPITHYPQISGEEESTLTWSFKCLGVGDDLEVPKEACS